MMSDSSLRLTCLATQIIKSQHCVKVGRKLQPRKVPDVLTLFLFVRKWPSQLTLKLSQVWAASGWLALCAIHSTDGMHGLYTCWNNSTYKFCEEILHEMQAQRNTRQRCLPLSEKVLQLDINHRNYPSVLSLTSAKNPHPTWGSEHFHSF